MQCGYSKSTYGGYQQNRMAVFFWRICDTSRMAGLKPERAIQWPNEIRSYRMLFWTKGWRKVIYRRKCCLFAWGGNRADATTRGLSMGRISKKHFFANQFWERQPEVTERVNAELPLLLKSLSAPQILGKIEIAPDGRVGIQDSRLLSVVLLIIGPVT